MCHHGGFHVGRWNHSVLYPWMEQLFNMDKIKGFFSSPSSILTDSAGDTNGADSAERGVIAEALDASTLSWSTRIQVRNRISLLFR